MKALTACVLLLAGCAFAIAKPVPSSHPIHHAAKNPPRQVPLPRPKIASLGDPAAVPSHRGDGSASGASAELSPCALLLSELARFVAVPSLDGPGGCGADDVVTLEAVTMPDGSSVALRPAATVRCPLAEAFARWVRDTLATAGLDGAPASITTNASYQCRPRNNIRGAKLSEHGRGNAVDVSAIKLANGDVLDLTSRSVSAALRQRLRAAACERFSTVLGPGADAYHESHIHLDLAERSSGHRLCQWDVREATTTVAEEPAPERKPAAGRHSRRWPYARTF